MMQLSGIGSWVLFSICLLFAGCMDKPFYERMDPMADRIWEASHDPAILRWR
jgi:hypothetical protein